METTNLLTALLTLLTAVYAFLTWRILRANEAVVGAMREERRAAMRPYVTVSPRTVPGSYQVFLQIENTGRSTAESVRLTVDRPFQRFGKPGPENDIRSFSAFSERIDSLPPGMKLTFALAMAPQLFGEAQVSVEAMPRQFQIRAEYSWSDGSAQETSAVDLRPYFMTAIERDPVAGELEAIRKQLEKLGKKE
jgi:hypothetical protein